MHSTVKEEVEEVEGEVEEDYLVLEEGGVVRVMAVERRMMVPCPLLWEPSHGGSPGWSSTSSSPPAPALHLQPSTSSPSNFLDPPPL